MTHLEEVPLEMNGFLPVSTLVLAVSILTDAESTLTVTRLKSSQDYAVDEDPYSSTNAAVGSKYKLSGPAGVYENEEYSSLRGSGNRLQNPKYPYQDQDFSIGEGVNESGGEYTGLATSVRGNDLSWSQGGLDYDEDEQKETGTRLRKNRKKSRQHRKRPQKTSSSSNSVALATRNKEVKAKSDGYSGGGYAEKEPGCCGEPSKFSELMAVISFLGLTFIVLYLLFQRLTTTTTTTGKEIQVGTGQTIKEVIGQFGSFVQSSLSDLQCTPYKICELGKLSSLMSSVDVPLMSRSSHAWVQGRTGFDCNALYPQCR